jgi:hypothetical protein
MDESEVDSCQLITNLIPAENEVLLVIYPRIGTSEVTKTARSRNGSGKRNCDSYGRATVFVCSLSN